MKDFSLKYNLLYFTTLFVFTSVFLLTLPNETMGQVLTAEYADVKLMNPNSCPRPYYDGKDKIYLFGGGRKATRNQIQVFSVATDTITRESIGTMQGDGWRGTVQADNAGNIFYFGGSESKDVVYKFDPVSNQSSFIARLPVDVHRSTSVKYNDSSNTVYIFGGVGQANPNSLLAFDLVRLKSTIIPSNLNYFVAGAGSVQFGKKAYIFDSMNGLNKTIEMDLDTFQMSLVGPGTLPVFNGTPSAVRDETHAYLIGGYEPSAGPTNGIYQFDLKTFDNEFLPVRNFPMQGTSHYYTAPASVYVQKQNRIYFFGGLSYNGPFEENGVPSRHDDIFFIDLSPHNSERITTTTPKTTTTPTTTTTTTTTTTPTTTPTTTTTTTPITTTTTTPTTTTTGKPGTTTMKPDFFNCFNRTNDFYPHPSDSECASYIGCHDGKVGFYDCPSPLLFNPVKRCCDFPERVECRLSCTNKPNGNYLHPHDCSRFIICHAEVSHVFKCPPPLLFNPVTSNCKFPEDVKCFLAQERY